MTALVLLLTLLSGTVGLSEGTLGASVARGARTATVEGRFRVAASAGRGPIRPRAALAASFGLPVVPEAVVSEAVVSASLAPILVVPAAVKAAPVAASVVAGALVPASLVRASVVSGALVPGALVPGALVPASIVAASIIPRAPVSTALESSAVSVVPAASIIPTSLIPGAPVSTALESSALSDVPAASIVAASIVAASIVAASISTSLTVPIVASPAETRTLGGFVARPSRAGLEAAVVLRLASGLLEHFLARFFPRVEGGCALRCGA